MTRILAFSGVLEHLEFENTHPCEHPHHNPPEQHAEWDLAIQCPACPWGERLAVCDMCYRRYFGPTLCAKCGFFTESGSGFVVSAGRLP